MGFKYNKNLSKEPLSFSSRFQSSFPSLPIYLFLFHFPPCPTLLLRQIMELIMVHWYHTVNQFIVIILFSVIDRVKGLWQQFKYGYMWYDVIENISEKSHWEFLKYLHIPLNFIIIKRNAALQRKWIGNSHVFANSHWAILPLLLLADSGYLGVSWQFSYTLSELPRDFPIAFKHFSAAFPYPLSSA